VQVNSAYGTRGSRRHSDFFLQQQHALAAVEETVDEAVGARQHERMRSYKTRECVDERGSRENALVQRILSCILSDAAFSLLPLTERMRSYKTKHRTHLRAHTLKAVYTGSLRPHTPYR